MIKYALRKNQLATGEPNFVANVSSMTSKTLDDLVTKMVEDACVVITPLFKVLPSIKDVFLKSMRNAGVDSLYGCFCLST